MHKTKKVLLLVLSICCCVGLTGCFYLRLQKVKNQIADFDKYFEISEGERFSIITTQPVLLTSDVIRIMRTMPSKQSQRGDELQYDYVLKKIYDQGQSEPNNFDINISYNFNNDKLYKAQIDKRYFSILPKEIFIALFKSLGKAAIDIGKRKASFAGKLGKMPEIPKRAEIVALLGIPYNQDPNMMRYKYIRLVPDVNDINEMKQIKAEFTFYPDGKLQKCTSEFLGEPMTMDFTDMQEAARKKESVDNNMVSE